MEIQLFKNEAPLAGVFWEITIKITEIIRSKGEDYNDYIISVIIYKEK